MTQTEKRGKFVGGGSLYLAHCKASDSEQSDEDVAVGTKRKKMSKKEELLMELRLFFALDTHTCGLLALLAAPPVWATKREKNEKKRRNLLK